MFTSSQLASQHNHDARASQAGSSPCQPSPAAGDERAVAPPHPHPPPHAAGSDLNAPGPAAPWTVPIVRAQRARVFVALAGGTDGLGWGEISGRGAVAWGRMGAPFSGGRL
jgi:hypothetical protein